MESRRLDCSPGGTCFCVTDSGPRQAPGSPRTTWNRGRPEPPPKPLCRHLRTPESAPTAAAPTPGTSEVPTREAHQATNLHPEGAAPVRRGACTRRERAPGPGTARRPPSGEWLRGRNAGAREKGYGGSRDRGKGGRAGCGDLGKRDAEPGSGRWRREPGMGRGRRGMSAAGRREGWR